MIPVEKYIDHTYLKPTATDNDVRQLCEEAVLYHFKAVCVPPHYTRFVKSMLADKVPLIATVIGFPFGYSHTEAKRMEVIHAIQDGAGEVDIVVNISWIKNKRWADFEEEIKTLQAIADDASVTTKFIIESGVLTDDEIIRCCEICAGQHVGFVKTSTGYAERGATLEAVSLMRSHLPDTVLIKASGGIKTLAQAHAYIEAGAARIGTSSGVEIYKASQI